jgi:uncharacterized protein (DUF488 family)
MVFTIAFENKNFEILLKKIKEHKINCIIDICKAQDEKLKSTLNKLGIYYIYMGEQFEVKNINVDNDDSYYNSLIKNDSFKSGISRLLNGIYKGFSIGIISEDNNPSTGVAGIFIGYMLKRRGFELNHILKDNVITQKEMEKELIESFSNKLVKKVAEISIKNIMKNINLEMDEEDFKDEMLEEGYKMQALNILNKR